jgi:hypothetical protein
VLQILHCSLSTYEQLTTNIKWKKNFTNVLLAVNTQGVGVQRKRFALFGPQPARNTHSLNRIVVIGERNVGCAVHKSAHGRQNKDSTSYPTRADMVRASVLSPES